RGGRPRVRARTGRGNREVHLPLRAATQPRERIGSGGVAASATPVVRPCRFRTEAEWARQDSGRDELPLRETADGDNVASVKAGRRHASLLVRKTLIDCA